MGIVPNIESRDTFNFRTSSLTQVTNIFFDFFRNNKTLEVKRRLKKGEAKLEPRFEMTNEEMEPRRDL